MIGILAGDHGQALQFAKRHKLERSQYVVITGEEKLIGKLLDTVILVGTYHFTFQYELEDMMSMIRMHLAQGGKIYEEWEYEEKFGKKKEEKEED